MKVAWITMVQIEVRFFNSLSRYGGGRNRFRFALPRNTTVGGLLKRLGVPENEIFLLMHNGKNIMRGVGFNAGIEKDHTLEEGDVLAFSGPVPFSRGYGSPVC